MSFLRVGWRGREKDMCILARTLELSGCRTVQFIQERVSWCRAWAISSMDSSRTTLLTMRGRLVTMHSSMLDSRKSESRMMRSLSAV